MIETIEQALEWLHTRGWDTSYRNPTGPPDAFRISKRIYDAARQTDVLHYQWCRRDAQVIEFAREKQAEQLQAAAPDLLSALKNLTAAVASERNASNAYIRSGEAVKEWEVYADACATTIIHENAASAAIKKAEATP